MVSVATVHNPLRHIDAISQYIQITGLERSFHDIHRSGMYAHTYLEIGILAELFVQFHCTSNGGLGAPQKHESSTVASWPKNQFFTSLCPHIFRAALNGLLKACNQSLCAIHGKLGIPHNVDKQDVGQNHRFVRAWT